MYVVVKFFGVFVLAASAVVGLCSFTIPSVQAAGTEMSTGFTKQTFKNFVNVEVLGNGLLAATSDTAAEGYSSDGLTEVRSRIVSTVGSEVKFWKALHHAGGMPYPGSLEDVFIHEVKVKFEGLKSEWNSALAVEKERAEAAAAAAARVSVSSRGSGYEVSDERVQRVMASLPFSVPFRIENTDCGGVSDVLGCYYPFASYVVLTPYLLSSYGDCRVANTYRS